MLDFLKKAIAALVHGLSHLNKHAAREFLIPLLRVYYIIWSVCFRCHSSA